MFEDIKKEIIKYGKLAGEKDLTPAFSGNISVRCGDKIIITASNTVKSNLGIDDFAVLDFEGNQIEGTKKSSSEKMLHIRFYKERTSIGSIFHLHSPYLTAFALAGCEIPDNIYPSSTYAFGHVPVAGYALPGSKELAEKTAEYFKENDIILMQNHGVIVSGKDIKDAFLKAELCESFAKSIIFSKILGGANILSEEDVKNIYALRS